MIPNEFSIRFFAFGRNFTYLFSQKPKDTAHHVYTINKNGIPKRNDFQEDEDVNKNAFKIVKKVMKSFFSFKNKIYKIYEENDGSKSVASLIKHKSDEFKMVLNLFKIKQI